MSKNKVTYDEFCRMLGHTILTQKRGMKQFDEEGVKYMGKKYKRQFTKPDGTLKDRFAL